MAHHHTQIRPTPDAFAPFQKASMGAGAHDERPARGDLAMVLLGVLAFGLFAGLVAHFSHLGL